MKGVIDRPCQKSLNYPKYICGKDNSSASSSISKLFRTLPKNKIKSNIYIFCIFFFNKLKKYENKNKKLPTAEAILNYISSFHINVCCCAIQLSSIGICSKRLLSPPSSNIISSSTA